MRVATLILRWLAIACFAVATFGLSGVLWNHFRLMRGAASEFDYYPFGPDLWLTPSLLLAVLGAALFWASTRFALARAAGRAPHGMARD